MLKVGFASLWLIVIERPNNTLSCSAIQNIRVVWCTVLQNVTIIIPTLIHPDLLPPSWSRPAPSSGSAGRACLAIGDAVIPHCHWLSFAHSIETYIHVVVLLSSLSISVRNSERQCRPRAKRAADRPLVALPADREDLVPPDVRLRQVVVWPLYAVEQVTIS